MTMKTLFSIVATLLVLAISGCAPQVDVEAEAAAIREMVIQWDNAANAKDVDGMVSLFADDASSLAANAPIAVGKEAIHALFSELVGSPGFAVSDSATKVEVSRAGDMAYMAGKHELTLNDPGGNPVTDLGKWVVVLKKQADGTWKIVTHIWNSDQSSLAERASDDGTPQHSARASAQSKNAGEADIAAGKVAYDKKCASCHGKQGEGKAVIAKMLKVELRHLGSKEAQAKSDEEVRKAITEGTGKMKPMKGLREADLTNIVAYVRTLKTT
jgi:uncharacterized protein (TIGR02246 family)